MRIAVVHEWLSVYGGSEKVTEKIMEIFPMADLYALVYDEERMPDYFKKYNIKTTFIQKLPFGKTKYQGYLPLMPYAYEELDMSQYDLVISSSTACAKGIITRPDAIHICYCHTPMRYAWDFYHTYTSKKNRVVRLIIGLLMHRIRLWDYVAASRVDHFVCNSNFVASRIQKYYRRSATVIYPPVETQKFATGVDQGYYLVLSRLVPYKRIDLAVEAFNVSGKPLVIIGDGPEKKRLVSKANGNIKFLGRINDSEMVKYYSGCRAFIFPGEEDFGITPVEAQASGKPVIAFGRGGALETVSEGKTGVFFYESSARSLNEAIEKFELRKLECNVEDIRVHAERFSDVRFKQEFEKYVRTIVQTHR